MSGPARCSANLPGDGRRASTRWRRVTSQRRCRGALRRMSRPRGNPRGAGGGKGCVAHAGRCDAASRCRRRRGPAGVRAERYPDNERLRLARASLRLDRGDTEPAARELAEVIDTLDAKRLQKGPLVRDLDGIEGGIDSERSSFARVEAMALGLRAQASMSLNDPGGAVTALQKALTLIGRDEPDMLAMLAQAAAAAGDTALAADAQSRFERHGRSSGSIACSEAEGGYRRQAAGDRPVACRLQPKAVLSDQG